MSYINPKLEVRECNDPRLGKGLFAREKIAKGEILVQHDGVDISNGSLAAVPPETLLHWCYDVDDDRTFCPVGFKPSPDWFFNHSCDPNMGSVGDPSTQMARRDIDSGEEVVIDYAMIESDPDWAMVCFCDAMECRGVIAGSDWMIPELQERYKGYFQRNIQEKIDALWRANLSH